MSPYTDAARERAEKLASALYLAAEAYNRAAKEAAGAGLRLEVRLAPPMLPHRSNADTLTVTVSQPLPDPTVARLEAPPDPDPVPEKAETFEPPEFELQEEDCLPPPEALAHRVDEEVER